MAANGSGLQWKPCRIADGRILTRRVLHAAASLFVLFANHILNAHN